MSKCLKKMHLKFQFPYLPLFLQNKVGLFAFHKVAPNSGRKKSFSRRAMANFLAEKLKLVSKLKTVRWVAFLLGLLNLGVIVLGTFIILNVVGRCGGGSILPLAALVVVSTIRILSMIGTAIAQEATATTIISQPVESSVVDAVIRHKRRIRYKRWLWWTRFGMIVTVLQFVGATYLLFVTVKNASYHDESHGCFLGQDTGSKGWKRSSIFLFLFLAWLLAVLQCFTGTDVLRWRSFYATHDSAWKAHYHEVFDHGIREALCCMGRIKYMSVLEEDEVYSVARLLGDLVAYRASGTGHLELLAGLALLQRHRQPINPIEEQMEAPESQIQEAATWHPFAEAAYTGPLLDFGRNPILFPCAWLYRQGVLTPWTRGRRPALEGDNWWRGHAAAFLKYVNLPAEALRRGRVSQAKREAAYFVVVLHHLRTVLIAVRGTETPEDLLTDGLCSDCSMSMDDLDGLTNSEHLAPSVKRSVLSSFPHYGHSGIVEAARELSMQLDGESADGDQDFGGAGFLSSLLGDGCECQGYHVRIVGHSLGGSIAALLGIRLYRRYPNLHVFSYGPLPCVDSVVSESCSSFVTSIIYNDEFSSRLSVNSILRLRAAAVTALSQDSSADSAVICKFARKILLASKYQTGGGQNQGTEEHKHTSRMKPYKHTVEGGAFLCAHAVSCVGNMNSPRRSLVIANEDYQPPSNATSNSNDRTAVFPVGAEEPLFHESASFSNDMFPEIPREGFDEYNINEFFDVTDCINSGRDHPEMYMPGLLIHLVPEQKDVWTLWRSWKILEYEWNYRAYVANKVSFKDIIVSPYMFLDHLPWRCHYAMQRVLETRKTNGQINIDLLNGSHMV
ncbi:uncharacterized protein [Aristolochia californica]|uniref:uncharacterized protein n=1 Tax=Aristolochia californica TaxID=171875 RepID=UPI0035D544E3